VKKTIQIPASEFKAKCLQLLDDVAESHCQVTVTKRGKPVARLVPVEASPRTLRGTWKGKVKILGNIVNFDTSEDWEANR
jgi:prevent-host-death family protein